jgi:hypothetical protein
MSSLLKNIKRIDTPFLYEIYDLSIRGLQISHIAIAIINHLKMGPSTHRNDPKLTPLGRWKVNVDNFSHGRSYSYDHSF